MKPLHLLTLALIIVGAVNWGLVGAAGLDLVALIFGDGSALSRLVYVLVGASGLYQAWAAFQTEGAHARNAG